MSNSATGLDRPRTPEELSEARAMLIPYRTMGYRLFPLKPGAKTPRDTGWQTNEYTVRDLEFWLRQGGNIGVALTASDLVLDIDPRNGGAESAERLEAGLGIDLGTAPTVLSGRGDGGRHVYFRKPADRRIAGPHDRYPGIDFKHSGLVVAPGSRHPSTGGIYRPAPGSPSIKRVALAPDSLLEALARTSRRRPRSGLQLGGGELTLDQLRECLSVLDPRDYGKGHYEKWIRLAAACHDATNGEGMEVFLAWAAGDEDYGAEDDEQNERMWHSFRAGRSNGATYLTVLRAVADAGHPEIAARIEPGVDFSSGGQKLHPDDFEVRPTRLRPEDFA